MKTRAVTWMVALALTGICVGQQSEEEKKFYEDYEKSELRTIAAYPDAAKPDSPLSIKMMEIEKALKLAGDPLYNSADKPMILAERAAKELGVAALAAETVQQTPEEMKFYADYAKSEQRAVAAYPDATKADSAISKKMGEMDKALEAAGDPLYYSADKPMILAERAAKELGVVAVKTLAAEPEMVMEPGWGNYRPKAFKYEDEVIPEFLSYKSVRVRKVEPDGLKIVHEFGTAKISIEQLSEEQRSKYGITTEGAAQYRKQVAANTATHYANQKAAAIQAQADAEAAAVAAQAAAEREAQDRANRPIAQAPVWKRFVKNEAFRKNNRAGIADEIRRQDGDAAADRFLTEERLNELEDAQKGGEVVAPTVIPTREVVLEGGKYFRKGDRITVNGDLSGGYRIKGDKMYSFSSGTPTHTRSGSMWIPLDSSQPQIRDPER